MQIHIHVEEKGSDVTHNVVTLHNTVQNSSPCIQFTVVLSLYILPANFSNNGLSLFGVDFDTPEGTSVIIVCTGMLRDILWQGMGVRE